MDTSFERAVAAAESKTKDKTIFIGTILAVVSGVLFIIESLLNITNESQNMGLLMIHVCLSIALIIVGGVIKLQKKSDKKLIWKKTLLLALLLFINCFSLNRIFVLFEQSSNWLQIALIASWIVMLSTVFFEQYPKKIRLLIVFLLGFSSVLFLYFVLKLGIMYLIGFFGLIFLGIGIHVFVPAILVFLIIRFIYTENKKNTHILACFFAGITIPLFILIVFLVQWNAIDKAAQRAYNRQLLEDKTGLPAWVEVSKKISKNWISERYLKSEIIYPLHDFFGSSWWGASRRNFDDVRQHDPLVVVASQLFYSQIISTDDKIQILASMYDKRHEAQERLWTGVNLTTRNVLTNVRLYPDARLAYTEKTITIVNNFQTSPENAQWYRDEAIYTFQLPEGSTVTSLSLWIGGKEQKAALTSKHKADSAYKTIVGIENRDPSVVHWQEGNTVSVRIFPCTPNENRIFKVGITSPLSFQNHELKYENITFVGPKVIASEETIKFEVVGQAIDLSFHGISPTQDAPNVYMSEDSYTSNWSVSMNEVPLSTTSFTFENESYRIDSLRYAFDTLDVKTIYLDINETWNEDEYLQITKNLKNKHLVINHNGLWPVTPKSGIEVFNKAIQNSFSYFPFYEIEDPEHSLIITKGSYNAPNLADLTGSVYADKLRKYFSKPRAIHVVILEGQMPPYIKMLKELRVIKTNETQDNQLQTITDQKVFKYPFENKNRVALEVSQTSIVRSASVPQSKAPEHLLRMFTYNNTMRMIGCNYFTNNYITDAINREATKGYVVTPVSSLIVLETAEDYKRFNINTDNEHSLGNASAAQEGATPEPFEWMLIAISGLILVYILYKKRVTSKT